VSDGSRSGTLDSGLLNRTTPDAASGIMPVMATIRDIVFDSAHPASTARFWAAALDGYAIAPYDEEELARLRANGIDDPEDDPNVLVVPGSTGGPRLFAQLVPEPKIAKNRVHLDLSASDVDDEIRRLVELGARVVAVRERWTQMADPDGNEFCVFAAG
jgi:hypothetical protein